MQYFTTCDTCTKLQLLDTDEDGNPLDGIGSGIALGWPDDDLIGEDELCSCEDW